MNHAQIFVYAIKTFLKLVQENGYLAHQGSLITILMNSFKKFNFKTTHDRSYMYAYFSSSFFIGCNV